MRPWARAGCDLALVAAWMLPAAPPVGAVQVPCTPNGLAAFVVDEEGLRVSRPRAAELREDDVVLQLNGQPLRTCAALEQALAEARERQAALLLLLRRGGEKQAVAIERWEEAAEPDTPTPLPTATERPPTATASARAARDLAPAPEAASAPAAPKEAPEVSPPVPSPSPARVAPGGATPPARGSVAEVLDFGRRLEKALPLSSARQWASDLDRLLRAHERQRTSDPAAAALDPIFSCYTAALEIVSYKEEATRDADSVARRAGTVLEYSSGSPVTAWLERFPFLAESVLEPPKQMRWIAVAERPGRWQPDVAVELLVAHAIREAEALHGGRGAS